MKYIFYILFTLLLGSCFNYRVLTTYNLNSTKILVDSFSGQLSITCRPKPIEIPFLITFEGSIDGFQLTFFIRSKENIIENIKVMNIEIRQEDAMIFKQENVSLLENQKFGKSKWLLDEYSGIYQTDYIIPKSIKKYNALDIYISLVLINRDGTESKFEYKDKMIKETDKGFLFPV